MNEVWNRFRADLGLALGDLARNFIPPAVLCLIVFIVSYALASMLIPRMPTAHFVLASGCALWALFAWPRREGG